MVAVIVVLLRKVTPVAGVPPILKVAPAAKLVPVIVTAVPPVVRPLPGDRLLTVGAVALKVNAFASVPLCPSGFVTVTLTLPAAPAGVVAVMVVLFTKVIAVAALLPRLTVAPATKFAPLIVIAVPPMVDPVAGVTLATLGAGKLYVNAFASIPLCPLALVTVTFTLPATPAGVVAVMVMLLTTITEVAAPLPTLTVVPAAKLVPLTVIAVPPVVSPELGVTLLTVGSVWAPALETNLFSTLAVACWIRGSTRLYPCPYRSNAQFQSIVPVANTQAPLGAW